MSQVIEIRTSQGLYAALRGIFVPMFWDNLGIPSSPVGSNTSPCNHHSTLTLDNGSYGMA
jgi:hypothetical protein